MVVDVAGDVEAKTVGVIETKVPLPAGAFPLEAVKPGVPVE